MLHGVKLLLKRLFLLDLQKHPMVSIGNPATDARLNPGPPSPQERAKRPERFDQLREARSTFKGNHHLPPIVHESFASVFEQPKSRDVNQLC